ncbi:MAG TPA: glycosyltransferase [Flavobacterium sp.]
MINCRLKVFIIGQVWPEPTSSAAGTRMLQLIDLFEDYRCDIVFGSTAAKGEHSAVLPSSVECKSLILNSSTFNQEAINIDPDVVVFDRFTTEEQFGWRVANSCPRAVRVLDTEDLHMLRSTRQKLYKAKKIFTTELLRDEDVSKREIASILRCDLSLIISTYEMTLLQDTFKVDESLLTYLPLFADVKHKILPNYSDRKDFIFIGNFLHEPNKDAVKYLKSEIWPKVKKSLSDASMLIYGAYTSPDIKLLNDPRQKFLIKGRAVDASEEVKKARIVLAPLQYGAGIKGKLLEAMACGTPSVTTSIGAEGMHDDMQWSGEVADQPEEYSAAAVALYGDSEKWSSAQENGFSLLRARFDRTLYEGEFLQRILSLVDGLQVHRSRNFIGSLLQHHTMRSTEFLSRWIEEKNK